MARIDNVAETQRSESFSYFQSAIRNAGNGPLDKCATDVARQLFSGSYDNDSLEAESVREAVFRSTLMLMGGYSPRDGSTVDDARANLADIKASGWVAGGSAISDDLAADIADLGQAVDQHLQLKAMAKASALQASGPRADFNGP